MGELAEIVLLRNKNYKDNWIRDSLFLMVGYMFCIWGGISSLGVDLVTLEQWLANLSTGQIQNVESYTRFTELKLSRDRSQESVFFKSPNTLDA